MATSSLELIEPAHSRESANMVAAWYGLVVVIIATIFASIDRQILLLVAEPLRHELALSDKQLGALNGIALSLVAALATFPLGWLADRVDRRVLLWVCVLVWSVATAASGLAHSYRALFLCSMGIAVGEAVLGPITYSLIPDLFPPSRWIVANYVFFVAGVVGSAAGLSLSGAMIGAIDAHHVALPAALAHLATWRVALIAVALPGPIVALSIALMRLRTRHGDAVTEVATGLIAYFRAHAATLVGVFVGFGFSAAAYGTVMTWVPIALVRVFRESPANTGIRLGLAVAGGSILGVLLSGLLVRALRPRLGEKTPIRVAQLGIAAAALLTPLYALAPTAVAIYGVALLQLIVVTSSLSLSPTMLQYIAPRLMRGRVIALGGLIYIVFQSLSPVAVGALSDHFGGGAAHLMWSLVAVCFPCFVVGVLFMRLAESTLVRTMAAVGDS